MNETTGKQIRRSLAVYGTLPRHINRCFFQDLSHLIWEVFYMRTKKNLFDAIITYGELLQRSNHASNIFLFRG